MEPKVEYCDEKLKTIKIRNFPMTESFKKKNIEDAMDYFPEDEDIIICSYPKTGRTWLNYILWKMIYKKDILPNLQDMSAKYSPFMEMTGIESVKSLNPPRVYKNHLPYGHMKINKKAKYIYIYRNPMDTVVSYYYFLLKREEIPTEFISFDYFFESFLEGKLGYGNYFDHVLPFYDHKNDSYLLLLSYEELHRNKKEQVLKIAKFLGKNYYEDLIKNETTLEEILTATEFNYMKEHIDDNIICQQGGKSVKREIGMFRKGVIGDGRNIMKPEQIKKLENQMIEKMKNTEILNQWII